MYIGKDGCRQAPGHGKRSARNATVKTSRSTGPRAAGQDGLLQHRLMIHDTSVLISTGHGHPPKNSSNQHQRQRFWTLSSSQAAARLWVEVPVVGMPFGAMSEICVPAVPGRLQGGFFWNGYATCVGGGTVGLQRITTQETRRVSWCVERVARRKKRGETLGTEGRCRLG